MVTEPQTTEWWRSAVFYQIYPRSWADSNGDGIGDFDGMTDRLGYLRDVLRVNAVWVSPFYPSPQADFGYDVSDYCDVDPMFGDLAAFDRFLSAAHDLDLKVVVDWVPNHTSNQHPWFSDGDKRDWYVWRNGPEIPNNWVSVFGGPAWSRGPDGDAWYLHSFLPEQPDLNWRNPAVESAMFETLEFWLDRGVDGFRIDVAHRCMKDPLLRDNPPAVEPATGYKINPEYAAFEHIHDLAHPDIHGLFRRIRTLVDSYPGDKVLIGEIHEYDWRVWASYYGRDLDELHLPFNFSLLPAGVDPDAIMRAIEGLEAAIPTGAWPNWVLGNHDEPRIATRLGHEQSKAAAVLLLTLRGTPTIYYGDELGFPEAQIGAGAVRDPWGLRMPGFGRDGCRTPMQWDAGPNAGFAPPEAEPWLPVGHHAQSVATQLSRPDSHLNLYRRLLDVRRAAPALMEGSVRLLSQWGRPNPLTFERWFGDDRVAVVANLSEEPVTTDLAGTVLAGTDPHRWDSRLEGSTMLAPWEAVVLS